MPFDNIHCGDHNGKHCRHPIFTEALRGLQAPESSCVPGQADVREPRPGGSQSVEQR